MDPMKDGAFLVTGLYYHDDVLRHAVETCDDYELVDQLTEPGSHLIWTAIRDVYKQHGDKPAYPLLLNMFSKALAGIDPFLRPIVEVQG